MWQRYGLWVMPPCQVFSGFRRGMGTVEDASIYLRRYRGSQKLIRSTMRVNLLLPWWRLPLAHRASPLEYLRLLDVAAVPEAAVLRGADYYSSCPHGMLRTSYPVFRRVHSSSEKGLQSSYHQTQNRLAMESPFLREQPCFWCTINSVLVDPGARVHY